MKYYNFETMFLSLADGLSAFLKQSKIKYERAGCFGSYHFEIYTDPAGVKMINSWLDDQPTIINQPA